MNHPPKREMREYYWEGEQPNVRMLLMAELMQHLQSGPKKQL